MPVNDTDIALIVGQTAGKVEAMTGEIEKLHNDVSDLQSGQEDMSRKLDSVDDNVQQLLSRQDARDEAAERYREPGSAMFSVKRPGQEPMGQFFGRVGLQAFELVVKTAIVGGIALLLAKAAGSFFK